MSFFSDFTEGIVCYRISIFVCDKVSILLMGVTALLPLYLIFN